jgi:hypothetical protein
MAALTPAKLVDAAPETPRGCIAFALLALTLRLALLARPVVVLDRFFVPDDTYYTLAIARSIARGMGPSVDGLHLTSGFQPLLAFLLVPLVRFSSDSDVAFRGALAIGAVADGVSAWLLGHLAVRAAGEQGSRAAAIVATAIWALSSSAIATCLNGLESSLAVCSMLLALAAWNGTSRSSGALAWMRSGMLLGVCILARVDLVFFVAIIGVVTLSRYGVRVGLACATGGLIAVAPWWTYALGRFGTIVPESGAAVREQALMYKAMGTVVRDQVAWAAGAVVGPPLVDSTWLRQALGSGASAIGFAIGIGFTAFALAVGLRTGRHQVLRILAGHAVCLFLFYALYLPAVWFFRRYLLPVQAFVTVVISVRVADVWAGRERYPWRARLVGIAGALSAIAALVSFARFATDSPAMTVDRRHHGVKGYRQPALDVLATVPGGAVVGSFQSGALGWFADGTATRVVNLDGVVDAEAARAVRDHHIAAFARSRGVTHLADWPVNVKLFLDRAGDARIMRASLRPLGAAEPQGDDERFVVYAIEWPDGR